MTKIRNKLHPNFKKTPFNVGMIVMKRSLPGCKHIAEVLLHQLLCGY